MKTQIIVVGATGRLGREVCTEIKKTSSLTLAAKIHSTNFTQLSPILDRAFAKNKATIIVDVSLPQVTVKIVDLLQRKRLRIPMVVGCTGFSSTQMRKLTTFAKKNPVLLASNFSLGVNLLFEMMKTYGPAMQRLGFKAKIHEIHHIRKRDKPSGTAKTLVQQLVNGSAIKITSERTGDVVGTHQIQFSGRREELSFEHKALDRRIFAEGAVYAAAWLAKNQRSKSPKLGKPFLSMHSVLFG